MAVRWEIHIPQAMQRHTGSVKAPAKAGEQGGKPETHEPPPAAGDVQKATSGK
jgi:hypothetical protein